MVAHEPTGDKNPGINMPLALNRIILYARDVEGTVAFYEKHFGFQVLRWPGDRIVELVALSGGANIMVHAAAKGVRTGQVTVKLVFDVEDLSGFCARSAGNGLMSAPSIRPTGIPTRMLKTLAATTSRC
jgi:hypothetical protein